MHVLIFSESNIKDTMIGLRFIKNERDEDVEVHHKDEMVDKVNIYDLKLVSGFVIKNVKAGSKTRFVVIWRQNKDHSVNHKLYANLYTHLYCVVNKEPVS